MPRTKGRPPLTRVQIVRTAIDLIDQNGMEDLTMRRLATALEVRPMALYYYFEDKTALLRAVINTVLSECEVVSGEPWKEHVLSLCRSLREVALRHPAVFMTAMAHEENVPYDFVIAEAFLDALTSGGVQPEAAVRVYNTLITFVTGFAVDEITGLLFTFAGAEDTFDTLPTERFPQLHAHRRYLTSADPDAAFEFGLSALIQGIGAESSVE